MISFDDFESRVRAAFEEIPPEFRERVDGPVVVRDARRHAEVRGMVTLGECIHAPDFAGGGDLVSTVVLYYGSFAQVAARDPSFDVEAEIVETVRHEVQHHVEDQVGARGLRDMDWAEQQAERWAQGEDFVPDFWRKGPVVGDPKDNLRGVGADVFLELPLRPDEWEAARRDGLRLTVQGEELEIPADEIEEDEEVFDFEGLGRSEHGSEPGDLVVILRRRRPLLPWGRG